jgi:CRISPR-associated protein Cmr1
VHEVTFTVETLTPLMLAGAKQNAPELRAPSFRGVLRYWLRALLGGLYGTDGTLQPVRDGESAIFGTEQDASPVTLRVHQEQPILPGSIRQRWGFPGPRPALLEHHRFSLTLSARREEHGDQLQKAEAALWLLGHFGGVGTRARRGLGNLAISPQGNPNLPVSFKPPTLTGLPAFLEQGLRDLSGLYHPTSRPATTDTSFDALLPADCKIWVLQPNTSWGNTHQAFWALHRPRETLPWPYPPRNERLACPLVLRVARLDQGQYTGVGVLFQAQRYHQRIESWLDTHFAGRQEVHW